MTNLTHKQRLLAEMARLVEQSELVNRSSPEVHANSRYKSMQRKQVITLFEQIWDAGFSQGFHNGYQEAKELAKLERRDARTDQYCK